jgi:hypothetical protein
LANKAAVNRLHELSVACKRINTVLQPAEEKSAHKWCVAATALAVYLKEGQPVAERAARAMWHVASATT